MTQREVILPSISLDIPFSLESKSPIQIVKPGNNLYVEYATSDRRELEAFLAGGFMPRSRMAVAGLAVEGFKVRHKDEGQGWIIKAALNNLSPVPIVVPHEFSLGRLFYQDHGRLTGSRLLQAARLMGSASYIKLQAEGGKEGGYTLEEIDKGVADGTLPQAFLDGPAACDRVVLEYSDEIGVIKRTESIDLSDLPARREGLDDYLGLSWKPSDTSLPSTQRVMLQRTKEPVGIPEGTFGVVRYEGLGGNDLAHGEARGLGSVGESSLYNWAIYGEHEIPRDDREWQKPRAMVVEIHAIKE